MDFTAATLNSIACDRDTASTKMYPTFAAPTPVNLSRNPYGSLNTLPSPLHLDFPSITPPRSPYAFYGMYSPASGSDMRSLYDPSYLKRLKSNPMFRDLQSLLLQECHQMQVPASLITTSWNLMHVPKTTAPAGSKDTLGSGQEVYMQHMKLQDKLLKVRIDPAISADGLTVENEYSTEVGNIEMGRYRALHSCPDEKVKGFINSYYDKERLELVKNTESKLDKLMEKAEGMRKAAQNDKHETLNVQARQGPQPSEGASLLLQPVDEGKMSAVRQLKFNTSDDKEAEDEEEDYLNGSVNSEDFEIDEIDVETVDNKDNDVKVYSDDSVSTEHNISLSPITNKFSEKDLLQQCIAESGISATPDKFKELRTEACDYLKPSTVSESWNNLPDSSTNESPDSVNVKDSSDSESSSDHSSYSSSLNTPQHTYGLKFTQPKNINVALTEIQKLCSGPTVSFTPELRRDITVSYTPDSQKCSPLSELCANTSGSFNNSYQNSVDQDQWKTTPPNYGLVTVNEIKHGYNSQESKKRKSCDDVVIDMPEYTDTREQVNSVTESSIKSDDYRTPVLKTHRMLTSQATEILTNWYQAHVQYPYPSDAEVEHLAKLTNITNRQVKKWMANKRVRCFNTLSITGNQHPIKYKYNGAGRRKRQRNEDCVPNMKENCDSTTSDNNVPYTLLNDESRRILNEWFEAHIANPYPSEEEKSQLAYRCGISVGQVKSWFANKRNRTNNTRKQVPNYFLSKFPEYTHMVNFVGQKREEARASKRRKMNEFMYIQPTFYL